MPYRTWTAGHFWFLILEYLKKLYKEFSVSFCIQTFYTLSSCSQLLPEKSFSKKEGSTWKTTETKVSMDMKNYRNQGFHGLWQILCATEWSSGIVQSYFDEQLVRYCIWPLLWVLMLTDAVFSVLLLIKLKQLTISSQLPTLNTFLLWSIRGKFVTVPIQRQQKEMSESYSAIPTLPHYFKIHFPLVSAQTSDCHWSRLKVFMCSFLETLVSYWNVLKCPIFAFFSFKIILQRIPEAFAEMACTSYCNGWI